VVVVVVVAVEVDVVPSVDEVVATSLVTLVTFQDMPSRTREMV
jgi:hypothetical protein